MHKSNWVTLCLSTSRPKVKHWLRRSVRYHRSSKTISDLFLPVTGEILEQNEALADQPELVNQDPYGEGWLIKIKPAADADFDSLLDAEAYKALINE